MPTNIEAPVSLLATQYDTGWRRCVVCLRWWTYLDIERRAHGWCDCGGGLRWEPAWHVSATAHHDPGDEDRSER